MDKALSISEQARRAGLSPKLVFQRMKRHGWTLKRALTAPKYLMGVPRGTEYSANPISVAVRKSEAKKQALVHALLGYPVSNAQAQKIINALKLAKALPGRPYGNGREPSQLTLDAKSSGIDYQTVKGRITRGWDRTLALSTPPKPHGLLTSQARQAGLNPRTVRDRIDRGWSYTRAISTPALSRGGRLKPERRAAIEQGWLTHIGTLHIRCGTSIRYTTSGGCVHCARLTAKHQRAAKAA